MPGTGCAHWVAHQLNFTDGLKCDKGFTVRVRTGANAYTWRFAGSHGRGTNKLLHLRAPSTRGRYRLVVSAHGHSTSATVIVRRR